MTSKAVYTKLTESTHVSKLNNEMQMINLMEQVLFEKLSSHACYGTHSFIITFTKSAICTCPKRDQSPLVYVVRCVHKIVT
jgi:hypothetical protein